MDVSTLVGIFMVGFYNLMHTAYRYGALYRARGPRAREVAHATRHRLDELLEYSTTYNDQSVTSTVQHYYVTT